MIKHCNKCNTDKDETEFYLIKKGGKIRAGWCRDCQKNYMYEYYKTKKGKLHRQKQRVKHKERIKNEHQKYNESDKGRTAYLRCKYGITNTSYLQKLKEQNGVCAICGQAEKARYGVRGKGSEKIRNLAIDHNHKTKQIRGLLCDCCNKGIGCFGEDIEKMAKAIAYIEHYKNLSQLLSKIG